jgi:hypothetical protein
MRCESFSAAPPQPNSRSTYPPILRYAECRRASHGSRKIKTPEGAPRLSRFCATGWGFLTRSVFLRALCGESRHLTIEAIDEPSLHPYRLPRLLIPTALRIRLLVLLRLDHHHILVLFFLLQLIMHHRSLRNLQPVQQRLRERIVVLGRCDRCWGLRIDMRHLEQVLHRLHLPLHPLTDHSLCQAPRQIPTRKFAGNRTQGSFLLR